MEIRARYIRMGAFTLAVIAAAFAFVYWLNATGGMGQRKPFVVVFDAPVSGLLRGSAVLFNGVRVGEVTRLTLDPAAPARVRVEISVEQATPVRADTAAGLDFQGLSGAPAIALIAGSAGKPMLTTSDRDPAVLVADAAATRSMSQAARDALARLNDLLAQNAGPLRSTIGNLETFSQALARNSDKLDGIVAGIERMTGGGSKPKPVVFDLSVPSIAAAAHALPLQLVVPDPAMLSALDNERIQRKAEDGALQPFPDVQWSDALPKLVQMKVIRAIEDAGLFAGVSRPLEGIGSDMQLLLDVRRFEVEGTRAVVELVAKSADGKGRITATEKFSAETEAAADTPAAAIAAIDRSFAKVVGALTDWLRRSKVAAEPSEPARPLPRR
jgi:phospholipid/cholesterol/gamma-HCH transport system substrate-binding protein